MGRSLSWGCGVVWVDLSRREASGVQQNGTAYTCGQTGVRVRSASKKVQGFGADSGPCLTRALVKPLPCASTSYLLSSHNTGDLFSLVSFLKNIEPGKTLLTIFPNNFHYEIFR